MGGTMLTIQHMKEGLSRAYTLAVTHRAGLNLSKPEFDYGIDVTISNLVVRGNRIVSGGHSIDIQLNSTCNVEFKNDTVVYDLEVKNYNDLVSEEVGTPRILVLFVMPKNQDEWVNISVDNTVLKNCAWWCSLVGEQISSNQETKTIHIPVNQIFTPNALIELMEKTKRGEKL